MCSTKTGQVLDDLQSEADDMRPAQTTHDTEECFATARVWTCNQRQCRLRRRCLQELADAVAVDP
jgi:hypothetical protein